MPGSSPRCTSATGTRAVLNAINIAARMDRRVGEPKLNTSYVDWPDST